MKGRTGANTGSIFVGRRWVKKNERKRAQEEARWASLAGPLTITYTGDVRPQVETPQRRAPTWVARND